MRKENKLKNSDMVRKNIFYQAELEETDEDKKPFGCNIFAKKNYLHLRKWQKLKYWIR